MWICFFTIPLQYTPVFHVSFIFVLSSPYLSAVTPCDSGILLRLSSPVHHRSLCYALRVCVCVFACVSASLSVCLFGCICCFVYVCVKFHRAVKLQIFQLNYLYSATKHSHVLAFLLVRILVDIIQNSHTLNMSQNFTLNPPTGLWREWGPKMATTLAYQKTNYINPQKEKRHKSINDLRFPLFFLFVVFIVDNLTKIEAAKWSQSAKKKKTLQFHT